MADNTILPPGGGGDTIRDIDKGGLKTQVVAIDLGGAGAESLLTGTLPVSAAALPLPTGAALEAGNLATLAAAIHSEDMLAVDLDKGIPALAVRQDMPDTDTGMTADYSWIKTDAKGRLWINSDVLGDILSKQNNAMLAVLAELRVQTAVIAEGLSVRTDLDTLRADPYYNPTLQ